MVDSLLGQLPPRLAERSCRHPSGPTGGLGPGEFILYWTRTAARGHDNPALDTALELGRASGRPVFVYQGLSERYPYAADRHHRFILEGARDLAAELADRGIGYGLHVERPGHRAPTLRRLAGLAAATVTEDMPARPLLDWTRSLAEGCREDGGGPCILVDTACLVPMRLAGDHCERAFQFRDATRGRRELALATPWQNAPVSDSVFRPELPFEPVDIALADLDELIASCAIDHSIPAVADTPGGSVAGYERWTAFRSLGLRRYDRVRNDPLRNGTSRMSAYLHYGHVSPFRLAREALADGSAGAEKFLDELMIWREMAYAFCARYPDHESLQVLPEWARATLQDHARDPRDDLDWESLALGQTGDRLWDACQRSLLIHGELHNNVRMTWGKAFLGWAATPARALALAIDLNHRYALDGRDPASFGGLLWCFGAFDRPFLPAQPILGTVRGRSTSAHAERLDVARYEAKTRRPAVVRPPRVAVIGAGIAGLTCARTLSDQGLEVTVLEKARGLGGRLSTRRLDDFAIDLGAPYLRVTDSRFRIAVESWQHRGVVAPWSGRFLSLGIASRDAERPATNREEGERFVGTPGMSAITGHLAAGLREPVRKSTRVTEITPANGALRVLSAGPHGAPATALDCDFVAVSAPASQTAALTSELSPLIATSAAAVPFTPCWSVYLQFGARADWEFDFATIHGSPIASIARSASKPGRGPAETWVIHASPKWSQEHLDADPDWVIATLRDAVVAALDAPCPDTVTAGAHRWALARPTTPTAGGSLLDADAQIGACGDWCADGTVEGAYLSGVALAGRIIAWANRRPAPSQGELFSV